MEVKLILNLLVVVLSGTQAALLLYWRAKDKRTRKKLKEQFDKLTLLEKQILVQRMLKKGYSITDLQEVYN